MSVLLLLALTVTAFTVLPSIFSFIKQMVELVVKVISAAFTIMFVVLLVTIYLTHGRLA